MKVCHICGNHGSVTIIEMVTCSKGCCKATRNQFGLKIVEGGDPSKCGGAEKHAAVGICGRCVEEKTCGRYSHLPIPGGKQAPPPALPPRSSSNSKSVVSDTSDLERRRRNTSVRFRSA